MNAIEGLKPANVWRFFQEISLIPRESKHEEKIRGYVENKARELGLRHRTDEAGNVVVYKPGTDPGSPVILQAHLDMVCEQDRGTGHDFGNDPIRLVRDGEWIRADGTTLGADNGVGVAAMLAIMEDRTLTHPDLELLFTIDEETGLTGANLLDPGLLTGRTLLNLDSEEDGVLIIGCAGGRSTDLSLEVKLEPAPLRHTPVLVKVTGLRGGHSGTDIHRGRGNAVKLLVRFLKRLDPQRYHLASISGGSKHNVIPREAQALILVGPNSLPGLNELALFMTRSLVSELSGIDEGVRVKLQAEPTAPEMVVSRDDTARILDLLHGLPHGAVQMSAEENGSFVVSSTNLAICGLDGSRFSILTNQRSAYKSSIDDISEMVASIGRLAGASVVKGDDYPAWKPDCSSKVLALSKGVYTRLFGEEPEVRVIHAGLECAVFGEKMPGLDMISLGPTIEQAHSPSERLRIADVERMWNFLTALLAELSA
ncbi:MAG TPA: aminoacyl-histidine dipeptidase [Deltaproteobacteria bacterium]|jgi:dipeptidase D|nr:aminoacyl-histidine dipeptidase [Deltaproteobacteria bacterium]HOI07320.1 aminoacyl-histidine dipeptidase [Deltaproteobacteria bacterium]